MGKWKSLNGEMARHGLLLYFWRNSLDVWFRWENLIFCIQIYSLRSADVSTIVQPCLPFLGGGIPCCCASTLLAGCYAAADRDSVTAKPFKGGS
eukprot:c20910_g1_i3 orf=169-450(+)